MGDIDAYENHISKTLGPVFGPATSQVAKPQRPGEDQLIETKDLPPIHPYVFRNVKVRSDSSVLWTGNKATLPKYALDNKHRFTWENGRSCKYEFEGRLFFDNRDIDTLPKGICGFSQGAYNWYHWLIEILPTIMLANNLPREYDKHPLLVPEEILDGPTFRQALELFSGDRQIIPLKKNKQYEIKELIFIPPPVFGPFNMHDGYWPEPSDYVQNIDVMKQFRTSTLERLKIEYDGKGPSRVFMARPPKSRSYNQEEILEAALELGFHIMRPEELSFREQVHVLHNADYVIGPTGAAWANSLFMRPGTKSLIWALKEYDGGCFFSNLTLASQSQMNYCFVEANTKVSNTYEAFLASYELPVDVFRQHATETLSE